MALSDPFLYVGRVTRGEDGRVKTVEIIYDDQRVTVENGDEFITLTTVILLETPPTERETD